LKLLIDSNVERHFLPSYLQTWIYHCLVGDGRYKIGKQLNRTKPVDVEEDQI